MAESHPSSGAIGLFDDFVLDLERGCLLRAGQPVHLRPQSYEVLKYLANNRDRLIAKDRLIEEVWRGRAVTDDSLVQCLRDVREALGPKASQHIRNVRGRGYIFDDRSVADAPPPSSRCPDQIEVIRVVVEEHEETESNPDSRQVAGASYDLAGSPESKRQVRAGATVAAVGVCAAAAALIAAIAYRNAATPVSSLSRIDSIAVLPFVNESGDSEAEFLSDGIAESLINTLSGLPGLTVKARSSVFRYKGREVEARKVSKELSVEAVLSGRVVQRSSDLTLYVSMADGRTGDQLWGELYHRRLTDLFDLQTDITRAVSLQLRSRLSSSDRRKLEPYRPTGAAYELYLKARHYARFRHTKPQILKGIGLYEQAIAADPGFAPAHAGLADAYRRLPIAFNTAPLDAFPAAKAAAMKALEIDPSLADAYVVLGWVNFWFDWDWPEAEKNLSKAIELAPASPGGRMAYAHLQSNLGRHDRAVAEVRRATELDPVDPILNVLEGQFLFYGGQLDEATRKLHEVLEIDPEFWIAHVGLGRIAIKRGELAEAVEILKRAAGLARGSAEPITQLGYALARAGRREEAQSTLRDLQALDGYVPAYDSAMIHNGLGDQEAALQYLERSLQAREVQLTFIKIDSRWDWMRAQPRFASIVRRLNLE